MESKIKVFIYVILGGLTAMLAACNMTGDLPTSDFRQNAPLQEPDYQLSSRVFDGRDSLTTGVSGPTATKDNFAIVTQFIEITGGDDVGRVGITDPDNLDPSTLLFESREGNPILIPDGDQISWGAFSGVEGAVIVKCTRRGTHTTVHLSRLIPNGVYSVWNVLGRIGPFTEYTELDSKDRPSSFRASASGEGHISGLTLPHGEIGDCMLDDVEAGKYVWRVVGIYHIDGIPDLDDKGTFVEQAGFVFGEEESLPIDIR